MTSRKRANAPQKRQPDRKPWLLAIAGVSLIVLIGVVLANLSGDNDAASLTCEPVSGFADVHGLAVAPDNDSLLYVATHHGLMRGTDDRGWCRLGATQDDFMGFTMHPENGSVFWVSGHPRLGGNMGVRQSTDGGYHWETLALEGVDFHAMTVSPADPERLWGSFGGQIYRSDDGGLDWSVVGQAPQGTATLAGAPQDAGTVYAATSSGLQRSADGGETWVRVGQLPLAALAVHPNEPTVIMASTRDGALVRSDDGGEEWVPVGFEARGLGHVTYARGGPELVYAATYGGDLYKSTDGGFTWNDVL